jgi:type IV secretory pathway VirB4 component
MYKDGTCKVTEGFYSRTIEFGDINYRLALEDDQHAIFDAWCAFLNFFDSSVRFELSFLNTVADEEEYKKQIDIPNRGDGFDTVREEYSGMIRSQLAKGNNGLVKRKFITFGIEAKDIADARSKLSNVQTGIINNFKKLGADIKVLNGKERLEVMHALFHMGEKQKFRFDWKKLPESGLSVKDYIAPSSFTFKKNRQFMMGATYGAVSFLAITAPEISDEMLADILELDSDMAVTMHIRSINQTAAIKEIKHKITELDRSKIEEQKKAVRAGYDMDIIPSDLATYGTDAKSLLRELQSRNERMFIVTFLILNTGNDEKTLENNVFQTTSLIQKHNCGLIRLDYQQEQGLMSSLPLALNQIEIERSLTTSSTAIFVPFTTQELFQRGEGTLYYGVNAMSNNLIMADRKRLKNPNGLILGTPGSGKSFSAKREIANAFLSTDDDVIICDPESEYSPLVSRFNGQVVKISPTSGDYINPMDINMNYSEEDSPLALKADFILSLCELILGGKDGLQPVEKTVIDRSIHEVYRTYFADPVPEKMPLLEDLYNALLRQPEPEAKRVATALEIYVSGSLNVFNHRTNVALKNRFVCYDIKDLGKQLKKIGMLVVQDQVWGRVTENRAQGKSTRYYVDEMHLLLKEEQTAAYTVEIWKRFRKWGGIPTGITQNITDLLDSKEIKNIIGNSDFVYLLNQGADDKDDVAKAFNLSPSQMLHVTHSGPGEGLIIYDNVILPFVDKFPKDIELYRYLTTKLEEVAEREK